MATAILEGAVNTVFVNLDIIVLSLPAFAELHGISQKSDCFPQRLAQFSRYKTCFKKIIKTFITTIEICLTLPCDELLNARDRVHVQLNSGIAVRLNGKIIPVISAGIGAKGPGGSVFF